MSFRDSFISALSVMVLVLLVSCEGLQLNRNKVTKEYVAGYRITDKYVSVDYSDSDNTTATAQVRVVDDRGKGVGGLGVQFKIACEVTDNLIDLPHHEEEEPADEEPADEEPADEEPTDEEPADDGAGNDDSSKGDDSAGLGLAHVSHMSPPTPIVDKCEAAAMNDDEEVVEEEKSHGDTDTDDEKDESDESKEEECVEEEEGEDGDDDESSVVYGAFSDFGGVVFTDEDGLAELTHQPLGDFAGLRCTIAVNLAHHIGDVIPEDKEPAPEPAPEPTKEPEEEEEEGEGEEGSDKEGEGSSNEDNNTDDTEPEEDSDENSDDESNKEESPEEPKSDLS